MGLQARATYKSQSKNCVVVVFVAVVAVAAAVVVVVVVVFVVVFVAVAADVVVVGVVVGSVAICSGMGSRQNIQNKLKKLTPKTVDPN